MAAVRVSIMERSMASFHGKYRDGRRGDDLGERAMERAGDLVLLASASGRVR